MVSGTSEMCSLRGWILVFTVQGRRQTACKACGWAVCWCQRCGSSGPWWRWGYGMGRRILWTQVHFIDGILRYCDEILRPIAVPFIHDHHLILQMIMHGSMLKDLYTQFLEAENIPVLAGPVYSLHMSHWACLGCSGSVYTTVCSSSCQYPTTSQSHWRGHNQQPDQLYAKEMCCTALREANGGHTRYWLVFRPPRTSVAHFRMVFNCDQPRSCIEFLSTKASGWTEIFISPCSNTHLWHLCKYPGKHSHLCLKRMLTVEIFFFFFLQSTMGSLLFFYSLLKT